VAQGLGANPLRAFVHVFLPLSLPGIAGAGILLFIGSLGFYITPVLLGGASDLFIANLIDQQISALLNWEFAAALSVLLLATAMTCFWIYNRFLGVERLLGGLPE
jgi:ABC-type spermidine/putrescine transport system permease subunit I